MGEIFIVLIGLGILGLGIAGILFVTIPSVIAIGDGAEKAVEGDSSGVAGAVIGGILLYFTTSLFVILTVGGFIVTLFGVVAD